MTDHRDGPSARERPPRQAADDAPAFQAIVLVHGMGEQIPMDTITGFADAVWGRDRKVAGERHVPDPNRMWSKPDAKTGSLELRRITTRRSASSNAFPDGVRTDFYELYWADLTAGSTWDQLTGWIRYLLFRRWSRVPRPVRPAWVVLWILFACVLALGLVSVIPQAWWAALGGLNLWRPLVIAAAGALLAFIHRKATASFGRVVRYTRADPDNIAARAEVRKRGLALLRALHQDPSYSRVVLVGHSLGSILAYDLLSYFWAEQSRARRVAEGTPAFERLRQLEELTASLRAMEAVMAPDAQIAPLRLRFREAQAALRREMARAGWGGGETGSRWLVTDLVTLGSPLTHAEFLLARDREDLRRRQEEREQPTAPPFRELLDPDVREAALRAGLPFGDDPDEAKLMVYPDPVAEGVWVLHHAAPFAVVRWTNLHDHAARIWRGDLISGPLAPAFGPGVVDINLKHLDGQSVRFTHTRYWADDASAARIGALRDAVNIVDL